MTERLLNALLHAGWHDDVWDVLVDNDVCLTHDDLRYVTVSNAHNWS